MSTKIKKVPSQKCRYCDDTYIVIEAMSGAYAQAALCSCFPVPCGVCHGARFKLEQDSQGRDIAMPCPECEVRKRNIKLYNNARVPNNYAPSKLPRSDRDKENQRVYNLLTTIVRNYAKNKKSTPSPTEIRRQTIDSKGLVLMGSPGTGKTYLMAGFAYQCTINLGVSCMFQGFSELLSEIKNGFSSQKSEMEIIAPHLAAELLIIDDLGKGRNTEWELSVLDTLISQRYNSNKPIMVTSNYTERESTTIKERLLTKDKTGEDKFTADTLRRRVGERIYSRLREMCYFETLTGRDRRLEGSEVDY
ncbi:MAG: ATP-binding protein [SAR324 cluster bacterium]|nr:ATP-binding protein [SAR324 cluster bacterium]